MEAYFSRVQDSRYPVPENSSNWWNTSEDNEEFEGVCVFDNFHAGIEDLLFNRQSNWGVNYSESVKKDGGNPLLAVIKADTEDLIEDGDEGFILPEFEVIGYIAGEEIIEIIRTVLKDYFKEEIPCFTEDINEQYDLSGFWNDIETAIVNKITQKI